MFLHGWYSSVTEGDHHAWPLVSFLAFSGAGFTDGRTSDAGGPSACPSNGKRENQPSITLVFFEVGSIPKVV